MLKLLAAGVWGAAMVFLGAYGSQMFSAGTDGHETAASTEAEIEQFSTDLNGVPVIIEERVVGYLVFRLSATIDRSKLKHKLVDVRPYFAHAGFIASYEFAAQGALKVREKDIQILSVRVTELVDHALGPSVTVAVNVEQFNFVRSDEVRNKLITSQ